MARRRLTAALLSAIMCLSLVSCTVADKNNNYSEYADSIDSSSNASTTTAQETTTAATTTTKAETVVEAIELTTENWQDYFYIDYLDEVEYEEDETTVDDIYKVATIFIKDGYYIPEGEENDVHFSFAATFEWRCLEYDLENLTATIGELEPGEEIEYIDNELSGFLSHGDIWCWLQHTFTTSSLWVDDPAGGDTQIRIPTQQIPTDFVCLEISGKVYHEN